MGPGLPGWAQRHHGVLTRERKGGQGRRHECGTETRSPAGSADGGRAAGPGTQAPLEAAPGPEGRKRLLPGPPGGRPWPHLDFRPGGRWWTSHAHSSKGVVGVSQASVLICTALGEPIRPVMEQLPPRERRCGYPRRPHRGRVGAPHPRGGGALECVLSVKRRCTLA